MLVRPTGSTEGNERRPETAAVVDSVELPNGVKLQYLEQGDPSGVPVVLLHGFADSWHSFEPVLTQLPRSIHTFALTQRGHGDSSRLAAGYGIPDFAADLEEFMHALHLGPAVIVGHSMGSAVALRYAIDHRERVLGLVLAGASANIRGNEATRLFWDPILSRLTDPVDAGLVHGMTESMLAQAVPQAFFDALVSESLKVPAHVWRAVFESRWRAEGDFSAELGEIEVRTLIMWGDQDARYPQVEQEALAAAIPGSRLVVYHGAGHGLHWEQPERFASDLANFVDELGRETGFSGREQGRP
jgi:pimeloyl-ACP methyl ester carboxylesterase